LPVPILNVPTRFTSKHYPKSVLNVEDYREAIIRLLHLHQSKYFSEEIKKVSEKGILPLTNILAKLGPIFVSHRGIKLGSEMPIQILRLGGRVREQKTHLAKAVKSPYLLHPDNHFTTLVVRNCHEVDLKHSSRIRCLRCKLNRSCWVTGSINSLTKLLKKVHLMYKNEAEANKNKNGSASRLPCTK
jgi:hypothetical protein